MRVIGMDIHRTFAEAMMIDGDRLIRLGRVNMSRDHLAAFAAKLTHEDHVVLEATGNAQAVVEVITPFVGRVVIANPRQVHLIAKARIKTDVIDATVLARLYASGFLPEVWVPDQRLASAHPRSGLCVGSTRPARQEIARSRTPVWPAGQAGTARRRLRIQSDEASAGGAAARRARRNRVQTTYRGLDQARQPGACGRLTGGATMKTARPDLHLQPDSSSRGRPQTRGK